MSKTIIGLITVVLAQFVPAEEVSIVMEAVGIMLAWYARYTIGDITLLGKRK
jgi:hypothetical protein